MNLALDMLVVRARRTGVPLPRAMIFTLILTISFNDDLFSTQDGLQTLDIYQSSDDHTLTAPTHQISAQNL